MGIISKIIQNFQKSRHRPLTDFAHPFCPYFTENFYRFMHNFGRCFCPRFSQKPLQLKGYFKVARAIFPPLFTPKFFSRQAFSNTASLAIAQLPPPCTDASMSVFRHTPLPQTQQPHRQPFPLKRVEFASKLQEKIYAANAAEHRENFAARKIQPRPAVRPDMTECGTAQKNAYLSNFKTTAAETANMPARFTLKQYRRVQNAAQPACRRIRLNSDLS